MSRQCLALARRRRCANSPSTPALEHLRSQRRQRTLNDMSLGRLATPSSASSLMEVRIGPLVEHHEPGVDREAPALDVQVVGMGVAAEAGLALVERHGVGAGQQVRGREARHACTDDGDVHVKGL